MDEPIAPGAAAPRFAARSDPARALSDVLVHQRDEEREQALRALLMRPLLPAADPAYALVRRHAEHLRDWLQRECGWPLLIEREAVRLVKRPGDAHDATRGLEGFGRSRYVLLCLVCMVLERSDPQITLRSLSERVLEAAADPELAAAGYTCTLQALHERRDLVAVCRLLLGLNVLARVAGDEEAWASDHEGGDVLYDVHRRLLALLPASPRGASLIEALAPTADLEWRLAALGEEFTAEGESGLRGAARHRLARRLLDDPVLYNADLDAAERDYLATQRGALAARLAAASGMSAELRAEGLALVDADGELSDERLPATGTDAHVTLLVAERLAGAARDAADTLFAPRQIAGWVLEAVAEHGRWWRRNAREPGAENALAEQAVERLLRLRLVERVAGGVRARPALLRFAFEAAQVRRAAAQPSLFEAV